MPGSLPKERDLEDSYGDFTAFNYKSLDLFGVYKTEFTSPCLLCGKEKPTRNLYTGMPISFIYLAFDSLNIKRRSKKLNFV